MISLSNFSFNELDCLSWLLSCPVRVLNYLFCYELALTGGGEGGGNMQGIILRLMEHQ